MVTPDLSVELCGLKLANPVIPASGTFGYGREISQLYDLNILGCISIKGTTGQERFGNDLPRIAETPAGMINAVGLANPGIRHVVDVELPELKKVYQKPVMANICGFSIEEYVKCCALVNKVDNVGLIELNISCPNVKEGGAAFGTDPGSAAKVTAAVKRVTTKPVLVKLSPNVADIADIARACEQAGADGLSLINTILAMRIDIRTRRPVVNNVYGGLSGPAVFPVALRMVHQVYSAVGIPVVGIGGISSAADVIEMMLAGATAVEVGSAGLIDPYICKKIIEELPVLMAELGIPSLKSIIGGVQV